MKILGSILIAYSALQNPDATSTIQKDPVPIVAEIKRDCFYDKRHYKQVLVRLTSSLQRENSQHGNRYTYSIENIGEVPVRLYWHSLDESQFSQDAYKKFFANEIKPGKKPVSFSVETSGTPEINSGSVDIYCKKPAEKIGVGWAPAFVPSK